MRWVMWTLSNTVWWGCCCCCCWWWWRCIGLSLLPWHYTGPIDLTPLTVVSEVIYITLTTLKSFDWLIDWLMYRQLDSNELTCVSEVALRNLHDMEILWAVVSFDNISLFWNLWCARLYWKLCFPFCFANYCDDYICLSVCLYIRIPPEITRLRLGSTNHT